MVVNAGGVGGHHVSEIVRFLPRIILDVGSTVGGRRVTERMRCEQHEFAKYTDDLEGGVNGSHFAYHVDFALTTGVPLPALHIASRYKTGSIYYT